MCAIFDCVYMIGSNLIQLFASDEPSPVNGFREVPAEKKRALTPNEIYKGVIYQARHDIVEGMHDADIGYVEVKRAQMGDDLEILGSEIYRPERGYVVKNQNNQDEIFTVQAQDLCDIYGLQTWPGYIR